MEAQEPAVPQPPRQKSGVKALLIVCIVLGAGTWAASFAAGIASGVSQAQALNDLRHAHNRVVDADRSATQCAPGDINCVHRVAQVQAAAFQSFDNTLVSLHLPSSASDEKAQLERTTQNVIQLWTTIERAPTVAQVSSLLNGDAINKVEGKWNDDYQALDDAVVHG
jgi:hypothetical protein